MLTNGKKYLCSSADAKCSVFLANRMESSPRFLVLLSLLKEIPCEETVSNNPANRITK